MTQAPDAELLRLGAELELVGQEWLKQRAIDNKHRAEWQAACEAAGLPEKDYRDFGDGDELIAYQNRRAAVPHAQTDDEVIEGINERMYDLILDVLTLHQPQTLPGLAILVSAMVLDNAEFWEDDDIDAPEHDRMRTFLERLCTFLAIKPAPIRERQDLTAPSVAL